MLEFPEFLKARIVNRYEFFQYSNEKNLYLGVLNDYFWIFYQSDLKRAAKISSKNEIMSHFSEKNIVIFL